MLQFLSVWKMKKGIHRELRWIALRYNSVLYDLGKAANMFVSVC